MEPGCGVDVDPLARLEEQVDRLLTAHGGTLQELLRSDRERGEAQQKLRQLEERLAQALKRVHELEQERGLLRERLVALPDPASLDEARRRLQALLETLEI